MSDPLSDVLSLIRPSSSVSAGLDAGGAWSLRCGPPDGVKFNAIVAGTCWVAVEGMDAPVRMERGDCFLLTRRRAFTIASDPGLAPMDAEPIYAAARDGIATCNGGGGFFLVGGRFTFAGNHAEMLFDSLPPVVRVSGLTSEAGVLAWALDQLAAELRARRPGGALISQHLAHIMLVQVLRLHLESREGTEVGWFYALADPQVGAAMRALHADPARRWTLAQLARAAGMSRSILAQRFRQLVGQTPMAYLTRWRMLIAAERLLRGRTNVAEVAGLVGYDSESAFSTAFKRVMDCSPRQYQRRSLQ